MGDPERDVRAQDADVWAALSDPTRRSLIGRLASGPKTTSNLCSGVQMSRFGVMKHLRVLEAAGLVLPQKCGRTRLNHLNAARLHGVVSGWLSSRTVSFSRSVENLLARQGGKNMDTGTPKVVPGVIDVALQWEVRASVQGLWNALISEPGEWWPASHRAVGADSEFVLEDRLGGQLREEAKDGSGLLWYSVFAITPLQSIDLVGNLAARYGGPATSTLAIQILPGKEEGTSLLRLTDSLVGRVGPDTHANVSQGWNAILGDGLVGMLDRRAG